MPAETLGNRLYAELWVSFTALIRSYVAAHDIGRTVGLGVVDEDDSGRLSLQGDGKLLALEFNHAAGTGSWVLYEDDPGPERVLERGEFRMDDESRMALSDRRGKLELEVAAEAFTAKVFDEE
jgi:hypothetical protein